MISLFRSGIKKAISLLIALLMAVAVVPVVSTTAFAEGKRIEILNDTITNETETITVNIEENVSLGILRIVEMDSMTDYNSSKLNEYTSLYFSLASDLKNGENVLELIKKPTAGNKIYAVLRDSSDTEMVDYVAGPITVEEKTGGGEVTEQDILEGCSVTIHDYEDGKIKEDDNQITVDVKLHESVENCYLVVVAYPGNAAFDPDNDSVNKRLFDKKVENEDDVICTFNTSHLPLKAGQKICAYLNVPVGEDNYKIVKSRELDVVDENGEGFKDYQWPEVHITDEVLNAGDEKLHITLTADERLYQYAKDPDVDFSMTVSIQQYPADEEFDFEGEYMHSLVSPINVTEAITEQEITLSEPLLAGYRVRAVVYWSQNNDLWIPKSNDYEADGIPDDSVLVSGGAWTTQPSVSIASKNVKAGDQYVTVELSGNVEEGTLLLVRQIPTNEYDHESDENKLFASQMNVSAGSVEIEKNSESGAELEEGNYLIAVLLKNGKLVAQSEPVLIASSSYMEPVVLQAVGNVYESDSSVVLKVSYDSSITSGMICLYKAGLGGMADPYDDDSLVGQVTLSSDDSVEVVITESITAGDVIVPYIRLYDSEEDKVTFYEGTAFTVLEENVSSDEIKFYETEITTESETVTVDANGYDDFKNGYIILITGRNPEDVDSGRRIGSNTYTGSGSYVFTLNKDSLEEGQYIIAYLYKYDSDTDFTYYSKNNPYLQIKGTGIKENQIEITTPQIEADAASIYVKADFDESLTGTLEIYSYSGEIFDIEDSDNVLLYSEKNVMPSSTAREISLSGVVTAGNKIIAVLKLSGGTTTTVMSEPKTVQEPTQIKEPTAVITETKISEGDVSMKGYIDFEKYYYDEVKYTVYNYTGDILDESSAKVLAENQLYSPNGNMSFYFRADTTPLKAGSKIVIKLTVVKDGLSSSYYSNTRTVEPAPDWADPTVTLDVAAVRESDKTIPVTVNYDEGYLDIEGGYYCNVTIYQFPSSYTDDEFEENELHENVTITQRIGTINAKDGQHLTTVDVPVTGVLEAGKRVIVKLRLPHPEWEGEEADYLSASVPIIGDDEEIPEAKVLLYNLGKDTHTGSVVRNILKEAGIETATIERSQLNETVGYLAGLEGFEASGEVFDGDGYETEFMVMSGFSETQLDDFLAAMSEAGIRIDHKAVVTEYNKEWQFKELIGEIESEHEIFQAILELDKTIKKAEELKEEDYPAEDWQIFSEVLKKANDVLQQGDPEPTLEDYQNATNGLKQAYEMLTEEGLNQYSVTVEGSYAENSGEGDYPEGDIVRISAGTKQGYTFKGWKSSDVEIDNADEDEASFIMPNHSVLVEARWKKNKKSSSSGSYSLDEGTEKYDVDINESENGTVELNKDYAAKGTTVKISVTPDDGYKVESVVITDKYGSDIKAEYMGEGEYSFVMPGTNVDISVIFVEKNTDYTQNIVPFTDVSDTDWYYEAVKYVYENGIMSGVGNGRFDPEQKTTRGMMATVLWKIEGSEEVDNVAPFLDVTSDAYYAEAVAWATENNIVSGYDNSIFGPDDYITREQLITILWRYAEYKGYDTSVGENENILSYRDGSTVSEYAVEAMKWACGAGIISGDNGMLNPGEHARRSHMAQMMMRFLES